MLLVDTDSRFGAKVPLEAVGTCVCVCVVKLAGAIHSTAVAPGTGTWIDMYAGQT